MVWTWEYSVFVRIHHAPKMKKHNKTGKKGEIYIRSMFDFLFSSTLCITRSWLFALQTIAWNPWPCMKLQIQALVTNFSRIYIFDLSKQSFHHFECWLYWGNLHWWPRLPLTKRMSKKATLYEEKFKICSIYVTTKVMSKFKSLAYTLCLRLLYVSHYCHTRRPVMIPSLSLTKKARVRLHVSSMLLNAQ